MTKLDYLVNLFSLKTSEIVMYLKLVFFKFMYVSKEKSEKVALAWNKFRFAFVGVHKR